MVWFSDAQTSAEVLAEHHTLSPLFAEFYASLAKQTHVPSSTLELCRLRIAQLHQCSAELIAERANISSVQYEQLSIWPGNAVFSNAEQACLALTEVYCMDVQAISDEHANAVKEHYGDAGLIALLQALGVYYGLTRMSQVWGLEGMVEGTVQ